jgi:hypothetical protein
MPWDYTSAINELINEIDDELYIHEHFILNHLLSL